MEMNTQDLIKHLEFEYHSIQAANPEWNVSLWDFLKSRKVKEEDIIEHFPLNDQAPLLLSRQTVFDLLSLVTKKG